MPTADLAADRAHLMHPLHHPSAYQGTRLWVKGEGVRITDATGRQYIDGLAGLWNVNIGHGRGELADAAAAQMRKLAFHSAYAGGTNEQAIALAERLSRLVYPSINTFFFTSGGAESTESSIKTSRFYWKAVGKPDSAVLFSAPSAVYAQNQGLDANRDGQVTKGECASRVPIVFSTQRHVSAFAGCQSNA